MAAEVLARKEAEAKAIEAERELTLSINDLQDAKKNLDRMGETSNKIMKKVSEGSLIIFLK